MDRPYRIEIMPGVWLTAIQSRKFKSSYWSLRLLTPLTQETAAMNAVLPRVLRRGTASCPDQEQLAAALDEMYGGAIEPLVSRRGECHVFGFVASFLDDGLVPDETPLLDQAAQLLGELLLQPATRNGRLKSEYVDGERDNLVAEIKSLLNDKRSYANLQLLRTMCAGQPYGVPRIGEPEDLDEITPQSLYAHYRQILETSRVELFYMGSLAPEQVTEVLRQTLQALPRAGQVVPVGTTPAPAARPVQEKTERLDVTQGKLSLGFFTDITANDPRYPALVLAATVFGGGATSKLFTNVREQMSLCYYASASFEKFKGVLAVASGVEFSKLETAKKEILRQLEACCSGEISDYELESARGYLVSDLKIAMDSPGRLDDFYMGQILLESSATMQDLSDAIARVTKEEAAQAARALRLDTIYELQGVQA